MADGGQWDYARKARQTREARKDARPKDPFAFLAFLAFLAVYAMPYARAPFLFLEGIGERVIERLRTLPLFCPFHLALACKLWLLFYPLC